MRPCELPNVDLRRRADTEHAVYAVEYRQSDHLSAWPIEWQLVPEQHAHLTPCAPEITYNVSEGTHPIPGRVNDCASAKTNVEIR